MTTPTPSPEEHRRTAEELLSTVYRDAYAPMHPHRVDMLNRAMVHALLSISPREINVSYTAVGIPAGGGGVDVSTPDPSRTPPGQTTPRKRAAKKTASKETPK